MVSLFEILPLKMLGPVIGVIQVKSVLTFASHKMAYMQIKIRLRVRGHKWSKINCFVSCF